MTVNYYEFHWDITGLYGHKEKNHQCNCEMCARRQPPADAIDALSSQPDYQFVLSHSFDLDEQTMNSNKFYLLKKMCANILRQFGSKFWCSQLKFVSDMYAKLLTVEFNGTMTAFRSCDKPSSNNNA